MPTYAVFGATGNCGSSITELLLSSPEATIHAYCRSATKLASRFPDATASKRIQTFQGQIDNVGLFTQCVKGTRAVFLAVTMNDNIPGVTVAQDTARTLIAALRHLRSSDPLAKMPKIVVLSSASLEPRLCQKLNPVGHWIVTHANSNVYVDLRVQEKLLRDEGAWLTSVFIKPGGLVQDVQRGHRLNLDEQETFVSYLDLAAGMIEAAEDMDGKYDMRDVSINNVHGSAKFPVGLPLLVVCGLLRHYFPWMHRFLPMAG